jgi:hypothetical protein
MEPPLIGHLNLEVMLFNLAIGFGFFLLSMQLLSFFSLYLPRWEKWMLFFIFSFVIHSEISVFYWAHLKH